MEQVLSVDEDEPPLERTIQIKKNNLNSSFKLSSLIVGNRVPHEFFIVQGSGESNLGYHPGAFDVALEKAGIENFNLISYSSIWPKTAVQVAPPIEYVHGAVLEAITAEAGKDQTNPKRLTAGMIVTKVVKDGKLIGGLVAEYNGTGSKQECEDYLKINMASMVDRRYGKDVEAKSELFIESIEPKSKYACALVVLGFLSHKVPILGVAN